MRLLVGTSGYAYKEWKGIFYPEKLAQKKFLAYYAEHFRSVEINYTFRRMPAESTLLNWAGQVPEGFEFVLKASQRITHFKRLQDAGDEMDYLLRTTGVLREKLGPMLFQLPPSFRADPERLRQFVATLPTQRRFAFEFRHESWNTDEIAEILSDRGITLATVEMDGDGAPPPIRSTTSWGYFRLRKVDYSVDELRGWCDRIRSQPWERAYVFFKHEDKGTGPALAQRFLETFG